MLSIPSVLGISKMMNFDGIAKERLCVVSAAVMRVFGLASLDRWSEGRCLNDVSTGRQEGYIKCRRRKGSGEHNSKNV